MSELLQPETLSSPPKISVKVLKPLQDFSVQDILVQTSNAVVGTVNDLYAGNIIDNLVNGNRYMWLALVLFIFVYASNTL